MQEITSQLKNSNSVPEEDEEFDELDDYME
jgi:hypothetical protein